MPSIIINIPVREIILSNGEHDGYETEPYEYEYSWHERAKIIVDAISQDYKLDRDLVRDLITDLDLWDHIDDYYKECIDDIIRDKFKSEAIKEYKKLHSEDYY